MLAKTIFKFVLTFYFENLVFFMISDLSFDHLATFDSVISVVRATISNWKSELYFARIDSNVS